MLLLSAPYLGFATIFMMAVEMMVMALFMVMFIWLLYLLRYNRSVAAGVGFIALAGVAVEIGVLMTVYLDQALRHLQQAKAASGSPVKRGNPARGRHQRRPAARASHHHDWVIIAGLLPIMMGGGTGSGVMRRIGAPMVGGMVA